MGEYTVNRRVKRQRVRPREVTAYALATLGLALACGSNVPEKIESNDIETQIDFDGDLDFDFDK